MKTLLTLFGQERLSLQKEIDKATSLEQVVKLVQNRLDNLEKVYIGELSVTQVRLAAFFLDTLRQSIATLAAAHSTLSPQTNPLINPAKKISADRLILKVLQALICLGILGSLFPLTDTDPDVWMAILLTSLLVGLEVARQLNKNQGGNSASAQLQEVPQPIVRIDSKVLLDNLSDALNTIDIAVARAAETNKPLDASGLEELPELLNLIQRLWGASFLDKPQMALELAGLLPQVLMEQGIRAQLYRSDDPHTVREYFDFEPSIDRTAKEYITISPALLKGDRLLRRGRVIEPAYSEVKD